MIVRYQEILRELVAIPSITGSEDTIARYIADKCAVYGHSVVMLEDSIAVHIPGTNRDRAFILNGHMDTIPVVDGWETDPFELSVDPHNPDRLIGLGASDMKAGLCLMLEMAADNPKPPCDVWLFFTGREEEGNEGAKQLTAWFAAEHMQEYQRFGGLILESTAQSGNAPFVGIGHRNGLILEVTTDGPGGHGSQSLADGVTAIEKLSRFITEGLPTIRREWSAKFAHDTLGAPVLNPTNIHAGIGKHNVIPLAGKITIDLRTTPALNEALEGELVRLQQEYGVSITSPWPPANTLCPPDADIHHTMRQIMPRAFFRAFPAATDLFAFLEHDIPMVLYGPGDIDAMHTPNEWISQSMIDTCGKTIRRALDVFATLA